MNMAGGSAFVPSIFCSALIVAACCLRVGRKCWKALTSVILEVGFVEMLFARHP
jgi:hypothetical protein